MSIIAWIIVGIISGWIAEKIMGRNDSFLMNLVIGVVGALIGGFILGLFDAEGATGFNIWSIFVAVLGAVVLLAIVNAVRGRSAR